MPESGPTAVHGRIAEADSAPTLLTASAQIAAAQDDTARWRLLGEHLEAAVPRAVIILMRVDERKGTVRVHGIHGLTESEIRVAARELGYDPRQRSWDLHSWAAHAYHGTTLAAMPDGLSSCVEDPAERRRILNAERAVGVRAVYSAGLRHLAAVQHTDGSQRSSRMMGAVHIALRGDGAATPRLEGKRRIEEFLVSVTPAFERRVLQEERSAIAAELDREVGRGRVLLDTTDTQVWFLSNEDTYGVVNQAHAEFFGYSPEEMSFRTLKELFPAETAEACRRGNRQVFTSGREIESHEWVTKTGGDLRLLAITKRPYFGDGRQPTYVVCTARDITSSHENEQRLRRHGRLQSALSRSAAGFLTVAGGAETERAINAALDRLGSAAGVDWAFLQLFDGHGAVQKLAYEWRAEGLPTLGPILRRPDEGDPDAWKRRLRGRRAVAIPRVEELEEDVAVERDRLLAHGVRSILVTPLRSEHDELLGVVGFAVSGTEIDWYESEIDAIETLSHTVSGALMRRSLEDRMQATATRLEGVIEGTGAGTWEWNLATDETSFDEAWAAMLGYRLEELQPTTVRTWMDLTHPDDLAAAQERLQAHFDGREEQYSCELRMQHRNGEWVWIEDRGRVIEWDENGRPSRMMGTHIDASKRKAAEAELAESYALLQSVFDGMDDGISVLDSDMRVVRVNRWIEQRYGSQKRLLGRRCYEVYQGQDRLCDACPVMETVRTGESARSDLDMHLPSGEWIHARLTTHPLFDAAGEVTGYVQHIKDITTERQAQEALEEKTQAAIAASRAKSEFLANMSHELRTPLNAIIGFADLLRYGTFPEPYGEYIRNLYRSAQSLLELINDILDFSKIEAGKLELEMQTVDLPELLESAVSTARVAAGNTDLRVELERSGQVPRHVVTDPLRLTQVLTNLLSNAVKFTEHGEVRLRVVADEGRSAEVRSAEVRSAEQTDENRVHVSFAVSDTGIGITPENQEIIFESFTQADPSQTRQFGGTGLGLAITNRILQRMGSSLALESSPGRGSTFSFDLSFDLSFEPSSLTDDERGAESRGHEPPPADDAVSQCRSHGSTKGEHVSPAGVVLLVEDERMNLIVTQRLLTRISPQLEIHTATNGNEAIAAFFERPPDLVLMDIQMPQRDGYEATRVIRRREGAAGPTPRVEARVPIVALTAGVVEGERQRCLDAGMDDYISKPVNVAALRRVLEGWMSRGDGGAGTPGSDETGR